MADESTFDPQSAPEGDDAGAAPEMHDAGQPSAAADAERALKAAQEAIRGLEASASEEAAAGIGEEGRLRQRGSAETAGSATAAPGPVDVDPQRSGGAPGRPVDLPRFDARHGAPALRELDLLSDVNLAVHIELGRTRMLVEDVLRLGEGAVVELDKLAGDPVDVFVNGRPVARGEVLVLNDNFCIRISEILDEGKERVQRDAAE